MPIVLSKKETAEASQTSSKPAFSRTAPRSIKSAIRHSAKYSILKTKALFCKEGALDKMSLSVRIPFIDARIAEFGCKINRNNKLSLVSAQIA
jgi:hypothetical protein